MFYRSMALVAILNTLLIGKLDSRQNSARSADSLSPYAGEIVTDPASLSGVWEAPTGPESAVGIQLQLFTTISANTITLAGAPQNWQSLEVQVYERHGPTITAKDRNFFSDSKRGGSVSFEHGRLELHWAPTISGFPQVDLDLTQNAAHEWSGRFHRGSFDSHVALRRPAANQQREKNTITGTWFQSSMVDDFCLHIAEQNPNEFIAWADTLFVPGKVSFPPNLQRPAQFEERYGDLATVRVENGGLIRLVLFADTAVCCPRTFVGTMSENGAAIEGAWQQGPNSIRMDAKWQKVSGDSCIASPR